MKEIIMRSLYGILAVAIGVYACWDSGKVGIGSYILFAIIGIAFAIGIVQEYLDTFGKQVIGLIVGVVLFYPITYVLQYIIAVWAALLEVVLWLLQFPIFILAVIVVIGVILYFVYDDIKYSKK